MAVLDQVPRRCFGRRMVVDLDLWKCCARYRLAGRDDRQAGAVEPVEHAPA